MQEAVILGYITIVLIIVINLVNIVVVLVKRFYDCKERRRKKKEFKVLVSKAKNRFHSTPIAFAPSKDSATADFSHMMCTMNRPNHSKFF